MDTGQTLTEVASVITNGAYIYTDSTLTADGDYNIQFWVADTAGDH